MVGGVIQGAGHKHNTQLQKHGGTVLKTSEKRTESARAVVLLK